MRVALYVHCYYPEHFYGTESYTRTIAQGLKALGHEPIVITATFAGEPAQAEFLQRYRFDGVDVLRIDRNVYPDKTLRDTYEFAPLRAVHEQILREIQPDIVHVCHLLNHSTSLLEATRALDLPTVATFTDFFGLCYNNKLSAVDGSLCSGPDQLRANCVACALLSGPQTSGSVIGRLAQKILPPVLARAPRLAPAGWRPTIAALQTRPDHLAAAYRAYAGALTPTRFLMKAYEKSGMDVPLQLCRFGIDIDRAPKPMRPEGVTRLGFVGQLAAHKGLHVLLKSLRLVQERTGADAFSLDVYGDESQDPPYAAQVRSLAEGLPVSFHGTFSIERIAAVLGEMDVLVIPSTWVENSPLILLQALATHTPVLVAQVEGMSEFVEEGRNGFTFPKGSVPDLAAQLQRFAEAPRLAREMSATTRYERTSQDMVADVIDFYAHAGTRRRKTDVE